MTLTTLAASETAASSFNTVMDHVAQGFEALGALILVIGVLWSFVLALLALRQPVPPKQAYKVLRQAFGCTLLLALEILVAADLIRTVAVSPTLDNVLVLGLIVLIRTFLSFSLEVEIEGVLPWRRPLASGLGPIKQATQTALGPDRRLARQGSGTRVQRFYLTRRRAASRPGSSPTPGELHPSATS